MIRDVLGHAVIVIKKHQGAMPKVYDELKPKIDKVVKEMEELYEILRVWEPDRVKEYKNER
jgi:hypothetical protein